MTPLTPIFIAGYKEDSGLELDKKPFLLPSAAFQVLENAYVWRERIKKRKGNKLLGRLSRVLTNEPLDISGNSPWSFNIFTIFSTSTTGVISAVTVGATTTITSAAHGLLTGSIVQISGATGAGLTGVNGGPFVVTRVDANNFTIPSASAGVYNANSASWFTPANSISTSTIVAERPEIQPGSVIITYGISGGGSVRTFTDNGTGQLIANNQSGTNFGSINYETGDVTLTTTSGNLTTNISLIYYPNLPAMGIWQEEIAAINNEKTIFFDTKYAYVFLNEQFQEFILFTTWNANDYNFFWATNYRGANPQDRLFFVTNFQNDTSNPMRYTQGSTWTTFAPLVDANNTLYQAEILIPYYGRLLALNTYEGLTSLGPSGAANIFNRCRFSQIGSPIASDAWRSDIFGKGGFIDAPTNEAIISAQFFKNTLIVFFERSTWQLRYVGEYGLPFIWERISSDFGSESQFSPILFDDGVLAVGNRAIISSSGVNVSRIDQKIPDKVFTFRNNNEGVERVQGARDFQQELVYWCYADANDQVTGQYFPNRVLVFNYRNQTWADYRDNVTVFGIYQPTDVEAVTWSSTTVLWNDEEVFWDDVDAQSQFEFIVCGNNQGFIHYFHNQTQMNDSNMPVEAVIGTNPGVQLEIPNHNLENFDYILLTGLLFVDSATGLTPKSTNLNGFIYQVQVIDNNNIQLFYWNGTNYQSDFSFTPNLSTSTYIGGGLATLLPVMNIQTKDFNPYQDKGMQVKSSYIDFLVDDSQSASFTVVQYINSSPSTIANLLVGNQSVDATLAQPFYVPSSDYAWHRFFSTTVGQYMNIQITYGDSLVNTIPTHESDFVLDAMAVYVRPGGKITF